MPRFGGFTGKKHTEETKRRMSNRLKSLYKERNGKWKSQDW